jgi:predicted aspartyl protease
MSPFTVNVVARNPKDETLVTPPIAALVDTGSELTWLPSDLLRQAGITPRRRRAFLTATKALVTRDVGYAIVLTEGYETTDEVVFAEPGDATLLGVRTLEGFGVVVDNIGRRFIVQTTSAMTWSSSGPPRGRSPRRLAGAAQRGDEDRVEALGVR